MCFAEKGFLRILQMSLLGSQVYANPTSSCWVSVGGDTIEGDLTVKGTLQVGGTANLQGPTELDSTVDVRNGSAGIEFQDTLGTSTGLTVSTDATGTDGRLETDGTLYLGRDGAGLNANTSFVPSAAGTNGDVLTVGGTVTADKYTLTVTGLGGDSAGKSFIVVGSDDVVVNTTAITANSIVLITRMGAGAIGPGAGSGQGQIIVPFAQIVPGVSFEAVLVDDSGINIAASNVNAEFSWVILN